MEDRPIKHRSFHDIMLENSRRLGSKVYVVSVDQEKSVTYNQINSYCNKVANFLRAKGLKKDDKVSLIGKNAIETMIIFFGVLKYGAIINPINFEESRENIFGIIERVGPKIIIYDQGLDFNHPDTPCLWIPFSSSCMEEKWEGEFFSLLKDYDSVFQTPLGGKDDIVEILFTSGSTEIPKGVVISREGLFHMVAEVIDKLGMTEEDRILEYRAYNWASPQLLTILSSMVLGATLILAERFSRSRFPRWLKENDVTISSGVPTVINILVSDPVRLHQRDVPALKFITSSSAPLSMARHQAFEKIYGIPINQMAGMSEAGWMIGNPPEKRRFGSVGTPFRYKDIEIVNEYGQKCHAGEQGEIVVRGKSLGMGYLNEHGGIDPFPEKGLRTGDLGYMDADGYVFILGRKKDLIIRGGVNISPMEITHRLMAHPYVKEAMTIGIPDKIYGEEVASFVVTEPGCTINEQDILSHCREKLPDFKLPKVIRFLEEIPKTDRGKVTKQALLSMIYEDNSLNHKHGLPI